MTFKILMMTLNLFLTLTFGVLSLYHATQSSMVFATAALGLCLMNFVIMWASIAIADL
jgi:hypothetical protein